MPVSEEKGSNKHVIHLRSQEEIIEAFTEGLEEIKDMIAEKVNPSREHSLVITKLDEARHWLGDCNPK